MYGLLQKMVCFFEAAQSYVAKSHQIVAVRFVFPGIVFVENQEIRQRYGKVFDLYLIFKVLFSIIDETVEAGFGFPGAAKLLIGQSLVHDHVRGLIVVVHGSGGLVGSCGGAQEAFTGLFRFSEGFQCQSQMVIYMVVFCSLQLSFSHVFGINKRFFQEVFGVFKAAAGLGLLCHFQ